MRGSCDAAPSLPASRAVLPEFLLSVIRAGTLAGGGGGGAPRIFASTYFPRSTGEVRLAYERQRQNAALAQQSAPRAALGIRDAAEVGAEHTRNPVVIGQPLVEERVVRRQQVEHAAIVSEHALQEELGFTMEVGNQTEVEAGEHARTWVLGVDIAQIQPLSAEVARERRRPRIGEHPFAPAVRARPDPSACP